MGEEFWKTIAANATPSVILAFVAWFGAPFLRKTLEAQQAALQAQHEAEKSFLKGQLSECRQECRQEMAALREEHRGERREDRAVINKLAAEVEVAREMIEGLHNQLNERR